MDRKVRHYLGEIMIALTIKRKVELFDHMFSYLMCECMISSQIMALLDEDIGVFPNGGMDYEYTEGTVDQLCYELLDPFTEDEFVEALREHFPKLLLENCGAKKVDIEWE